ncbi:hypothetical protein ABZ353_10820 [Streptomyces niveus]|uniref:hypothetical protein n=1 Tax=Streptomyces niveus TaxID=193462 RepID=UPI0033DDC160
MFNIGDSVMSTYTDTPGKVVYGPYVRAAMGQDAYLVELLEGENKGECSVWHSQDMEAVPKYKVGDRVKTPFGVPGNFFEIVAGPFPHEKDTPFWVIKDRKGNYDSVYEENLIPFV